MGFHPSVFDWNRKKASSHDGRSSMTQWKGCHEDAETASVRRMTCRVVNEASLKQVVAQIVTGLQVTMLNLQQERPHVYKVTTLFTLHGCRSSQCCTSTDLFFYHDRLSQPFLRSSEKKWSSHVADLVLSPHVFMFVLLFFLFALLLFTFFYFLLCHIFKLFFCLPLFFFYFLTFHFSLSTSFSFYFFLFVQVFSVASKRVSHDFDHEHEHDHDHDHHTTTRFNPTRQRVGSLPQGHPGLWGTPVGPGRTPTVHRCPKGEAVGGPQLIRRHRTARQTTSLETNVLSENRRQD